MNKFSNQIVESDSSLEIRAAWLAYVGGYTQEQIAERLGVSRVKVHRLIAAATEHGVVKFSVEGAPAACIALEDGLSKAFGLERCVVVPNLDPPSSSEAEITALGAAASKFIARELESGRYRNVGVGHGRTLAAVVGKLPRLTLPETRFFSLLGSLTRRSAANPFDVISQLAQRTESECFFLPVPFMADSPEDAEVLRLQRGVSEALEMARACELCVVGIGDLEASTHLLKSGSVTEEELNALHRLGAVGELAGRFIDADGRLVDGPMNRRAVGVHLEDLRGRKVLAVAGGLRKSKAIRAALRTGVITSLIVDEETAAEVLHPKAADR